MSPVAAPVVVVGVDGSPASFAAVDLAVDQAGNDGRVVVVHAYTPAPAYDGFSYAAMVEDMHKAAEALLEDLESKTTKLAGSSWERRVVLGPPARALVDEAKDQQAEAIVIGSRGVGYLHALLGSVAYETIHLAHCPVLVVPARMLEDADTEPRSTAVEA